MYFSDFFQENLVYGNRHCKGSVCLLFVQSLSLWGWLVVQLILLAGLMRVRQKLLWEFFLRVVNIEPFYLYVRHHSFWIDHVFLAICFSCVKVMVWRKALAFEEKLKPVSEIDQGLKKTHGAKIWNFSVDNNCFLKKEKALNMSWKEVKWIAGEKEVDGDINKATLRWFHKMRKQNVPLSGSMKIEKFCLFAKQKN